MEVYASVSSLMDDHLFFHELQEVIQTSTVEVYEEQFRRLQTLVATQYTDLDETYFIQCCIYGFDPEIKKFVKSCSPLSLESCFRLARMKERLLKFATTSIPESSISNKVMDSSHFHQYSFVSPVVSNVSSSPVVMESVYDNALGHVGDTNVAVDTIEVDEFVSGKTNEEVVVSSEASVIDKDNEALTDNQKGLSHSPVVLIQSLQVGEVMATILQVVSSKPITLYVRNNLLMKSQAYIGVVVIFKSTVPALQHEWWLLFYPKAWCQVPLSSDLLAFKGGTCLQVLSLHYKDSFSLGSSGRQSRISAWTSVVRSVFQMTSPHTISILVFLCTNWEVEEEPGAMISISTVKHEDHKSRQCLTNSVSSGTKKSDGSYFANPSYVLQRFMQEEGDENAVVMDGIALGLCKMSNHCYLSHSLGVCVWHARRCQNFYAHSPYYVQVDGVNVESTVSKGSTIWQVALGLGEILLNEGGKILEHGFGGANSGLMYLYYTNDPQIIVVKVQDMLQCIRPVIQLIDF